MHDVIMFLCVLVLAVMVITVVGTVGGLWYARSMRSRASKVTLPVPTNYDIEKTMGRVQWCMEFNKLPELEAVLSVRGDYLPSDVRTVAWQWLDAARRRQGTNKTATS